MKTSDYFLEYFLVILAGVLMALAIMTLGLGCSQLYPVRDKVVAGVKAYCKTPLEQRLAIRNAVNESLKGVGSITVTCEGDPQ